MPSVEIRMKEADSTDDAHHEDRRMSLPDAIAKVAWERVRDDELGKRVRIGDTVNQICRVCRGLVSVNGSPRMNNPLTEDELLKSLAPAAAEMREATRLDFAIGLLLEGLLSVEKATLFAGTDSERFLCRLDETEHREDQELGDTFESLASSIESAGITESDLQSTLPEARARVVTRRYPELAGEIEREREAERR